MASTIQGRVADGLKRKSDFLLESEKNRTEYNLYEALKEEKILAKLKNSREHCEEGKCREADCENEFSNTL